MFATRRTTGLTEEVSDSCSQGHRWLRCSSIRSAALGGHCDTRVLSNRLVNTWRSFSHQPDPWSSQPWPIASTEDSPSSWRVISVRSTRTGIQGWPQPGNRSCVIMQTETPAWCVGRTPLPRVFTNPVGHPVSLTLWWSRTSSYRCTLPYTLHSARITNLSWSTPRAKNNFRSLWAAPTGLGSITGLSWGQIPGESRVKRRGGNRQVLWGAEQPHRRGQSGNCS